MQTRLAVRRRELQKWTGRRRNSRFHKNEAALVPAAAGGCRAYSRPVLPTLRLSRPYRPGYLDGALQMLTSTASGTSLGSGSSASRGRGILVPPVSLNAHWRPRETLQRHRHAEKHRQQQVRAFSELLEEIPRPRAGADSIDSTPYS